MNSRFLKIADRFLLTLSFLVGAPVLADVEAVRVGRAPDHTRLVFDLSNTAQYDMFSLSDPERLVIDFNNASLAADLGALDFSDSPVINIRTAMRDNNSLRVVLDLAARVNPSAFTLGPNGEYRDQLVVDLFDLDANRSTGAAINSSITPSNTPSANNPPVVTARTTQVVQSNDRRDLVVAIVAGHGGEDPGALSHDRKIMEKDVTLAIARAIRDRLNMSAGYHPVMIRDGDYTVKLQDRPNIGRENRVDIYLSIHADSYSGESAQGVTIYALSGDTADAENARRISQKENRVDLLGGIEGDTSIANIDDDLALTLLDLSMAWSIEQSVKLGTQILAALDPVTKLRRDKVQAGNLWELRSPDIPSLLIETGYLSNATEAKRLSTRSYQEQLATAIVQGVMNYFYEAPPVGTLVAWQKANGIKPMAIPSSYTVKRGDSLSVIAQRFGVSLTDLKSGNGLSSNTIHVGQELKIPGAAAPSAHTIARGETLSEIAQRYQVSLSSLRRANNISGDRIMVGQVLQIPSI